MKLKYLAVVFAVFFLLLGVVSADDLLLEVFSNESSEFSNDINYFDKATVVSLGNLDFTIPAGYGPVEQWAIHRTENGVKKDSEFFVNENEKVIAICVFSGNIDPTLSHYGPRGGQKETIKGHEGWLCSQNSYKYFTYNDNNRAVLIQAPSIADIEGVIPK